MTNHYTNLIVDGNNFLYRAFYTKSVPRMVDGINTTPIYKFMVMLRTVVAQFTPDNIYFTWDKRINPDTVNFRRELSEGYKDNRTETDDTRSIHSYFPLLIELCNSLGIKTILPYDLEGDDVICYITNKTEGTNVIVSSDKDLLQLVSETTHQFLPNKQIIVNTDNFDLHAGCKLSAYVYYKAIMGDTSDNIKGLPGFGPVKSKILAERIYNQPIDEIEELSQEYKNILAIGLDTVDLSRGISYRPNDLIHFEQQWNDNHSEFDRDQMEKLCHRYKFNDIIRQMGSWGPLFKEKIGNDVEDWLKNISM